MPSEPILVNSSISSTGDITAIKFYGDGSGLVNITTTNLPTPRTIAATGDATWSVSFDGTQNVSGVLTLANSGATAGTYTKVTVDAKGRVTTGANLVAGDLPSHTHTIAQISDGSVLVKTTDTGTVTNTMLAGSIANGKLVNSSITLNGVSVSLGGTATIPSSSAGTLTIGSYLTGGSYNGSGNVTIAANASSANGSSTLVARDASGNFSAGIITATLNGVANNISQYVINQDVGLTSSPSFTQVTATTSLTASGTNGIVYLNRSSNASISEVNFQTASSTNWKLGLAATATPNISFATADGNSRLTLTQAGVLTVSGGITGVRYPRPSVNNNLGNPTVEEMALFGSQMSNKIRGIVPYLQEESTDGNTWTTSTRLTAGQLAGLVIGDGNVFASPTIIPITTVGSSGHYRLVWDATNTGYVWLNAFYAYMSTKSSNVTVKLEIYNTDLAAWSTVVTGSVNGWPNHIYIPHDAFHFSTFSGASMHRYARITFSLASSVYGSEYGGVELSSVEWMGGYPAGRRNVEYYDNSLNAHWAGSVYASSFVDENNTTYYLDPSSTTTALTVAGAATVGRGIGGGEAIALVLSSAETGAGGATSIRAFPRGGGGTSNASARIRFTSSTGPSAGIQFYTGGTVGGITSESLVLSLNPGTTTAAFSGDVTVGGALTVTGAISAASFTGTISNAGTANTLTSIDNRTINPSETSISRAQFGFTSWNNNDTSPYADYLHLRSYLDSSGGSDNLVMFRRNGIGMRIWQQTFGSSDAYSTYKDIAFTDGTNATGTWTLNTSGYAAYIQGPEIALAFATAPRTSTQPFSVKLFDNYNTAGWPAQYGTIMEIYGKVGHQIDQLHFGNDRKIYHRSAFYNENTWTTFQKILESDDASSTNVGNKVVIRNSAGDFSAGTITATLTGNASTVTNGVYTTGSYTNPAWITSLDASKLTGDQTIPNVVLPGQLRTEQISTTSLAAGAWYTIATNDGNRANGKFIITDATPGLHQSVHLYASHHYGAGNKISIIHNDSYGGGGPVRYMRIMEGGTYDGAMLQIYIDNAVTGALPLRIYLYEDVQANGWALKNFIPDGTDPGGTGNFANLTNVAAQVDLDLGATIFSGNIYAGTSTNTGQYRVYTTNDSSSTNTQNTLVLRDASGNFSAGAVTLGTALAIGSGGTGATTAPTARTALGATAVGSNLFTLADPSAIRFLRLNADNTVSALSAEDFKTAIGAGSGGGSVTSVSGTGSVNGITLTGTVTTSGPLTLGGTLSNVSLTTQVTGTLPIANGGTNATTSTGANTNIVNFGQLESHTAYADFNTVPSTWGFTFVNTPASNAPNASSTQWYRGRLSLGSGYGIGTTGSSYWLELAMPRYNGTTNGNMYFRTTEAGVAGAWYGVRATYAETAGSVTGGIYTTGDQTITGIKTFSDTIKASRIEASSSTNITLVPAGTSGEVAIRRGSDDNLAFTLRPTGANNGYIRSGSTTGVFTIDSNDFRVRSYEQDVDRLRITSTESVFVSPLRVTGNLTAGDGLFIISNVASRSYYDANTGAYFHTPGAMVRKDSASNVPGEMPATFVLYNRNGGNDTGTKLVFSSSESGTTSANAVATAAIVSQKVSATDGNWAVGNLRFYVKNTGVYEEVLTLNASKTAAFKGPIQLENNVAQYWLDSTGNSRRVSLVSGGNASYFGPVDAGWGGPTYVSAGTAMILRTNGGGGTFVEAVTLATGGNVTVAKDLIVNGTGGITVSTSSGTTPVITATSTNGVAGYFVSDGHLNDLQANTSTHFVIKRSKNTATQNRWAMQLQGGENTSDSPVEGSNLAFVYSSAGTGTWTNGLTLSRAGNATVAGSITAGGTAFGLTNSNNGETGVTVTNTNTGASALAKLGTWNGTVGVNLATFSTAYSGRSNESWLYTNAAYALKLGTNNTERIGISGTGEVSISSSLAVTPLFTRARKLEAHISHVVSAEDYLRIGSNSGTTNTYAAEFGYGLTSVGDPQIRINRIHAGTVSRWLSGRTQTGNAIFANSLGIGGIGGIDDPASRLHVYENTSTVGDSNGITIEQAGTSDATIQFVLTSVQRWSMGVDNSDSDRFKIGTGNLGAADRFVLDTSGNTAIAGNLTVNGTGTSTFATGSTIRSSGTISIDSGTSANRYDIYRDGTGAASRLGHLITYGSQTGYGAFTWANVDNGQIFDLYNTGNADLWGNMTIGRRSAGDSIIKLWRSQGGNEWVQLAAHSGGTLGNNQYSFDVVNGTAPRPFYFRRSTDAGTSYTNFLVWDTSNNAAFSGSVSSGGSFAASGNVSVTSSGGLTLRLGKVVGSPFNATDAFIGINDSGGPGSNAGDLLYIPRSSTGIATAHRWFGHNSGTGAVSEKMSLSATTGLLTVYGSITTSSSGIITIAGDPTGDRSAITRVWSVSRGENLVTNGSGLMGNNYNFTGLTFDAVQTHGGGGSFRATAVYGSYTSDEFLPVDPEKNYRFALWARSGQDGGVDYSASNLQYAGIVPYDIDGLTVFPFTYAKYPGSTDTTLAAALNPGDTTVTLTSSAGWANTGSANYQRQFAWYGYTNSKGYTYPNYTYTRNYSWNYAVYQGDPAGAWAVGGITGNVITLNAPWPGPAVAAGTAIRNINSGGTFKYITLASTFVPNTWTRYEGYIGGLDTGGTQNTNQFPYGTAFVKLLFLSNYHGVANNTIRYSDLWFSEMSSRNLEPATDTFAGVVSTTTQTFAGAKTFSTDVRAPIFYDSVDTGYWISPRSAQTSSEGGRIKRNFTVNAEGAGAGFGLALYPQYTAQSLPTYGIVFAQTASLGTHGSVTGDWATYFTTNDTAGRGWVFRNTSNPANVASITNTGILSCKTVVAGSVGSPVGSAALVVNGTAGEDDSQLIIKKPTQSTFSVLAWNGINYLGSNIYYNNAAWVHDGPNTSNQLLGFVPGVGVKWWASNNGSDSWNDSNNKILWDQYGQWQSTLTNTLTLNTSGTGLSGSTTFNNSSAATFTVTSNATSANTVSTVVARDASGNFSAGTITATLTGTASALVTGNNYQVNSLGVGTAASATAGEIRATNNVTAYYSDERLKTRLGGIEDPLKKVMSLSGFYFAPNDTAMALGYQKKIDVGVSAQEVQKVLPEIIAPAPIDPQYMTVRYEKMIPLLIEAIKEQQSQIEELKTLIAKLTNK